MSYRKRMGGTPRGKDKARPSYEDGELRDETIRERQDATYSRPALKRLIRKASAAAKSD
jgi:hypothetical protein